jgi:hypothetical protein
MSGMMADLARGAVAAALKAYYRHSPAAVAKLNVRSSSASMHLVL